jgi:2-oxoglutarate ferredoxin oxidoreductase subunit delta
MNRVVVDKDRCKACGICIKACNKDLLALAGELNAKGYHPIAVHDLESCTACGLCGVVCPEGALAIFKEIIRLRKTG